MKRITPFPCPGCARNLLIFQDFDEQKITIYSELDPAPDEEVPPAKRRAVNGKSIPRRCKQCGKVGHRRDGCPNSREENKYNPLDIKALKMDGLSSEKIAEKLGIPLEVVNKHW